MLQALLCNLVKAVITRSRTAEPATSQVHKKDICWFVSELTAGGQLHMYV